jgi:D-glycero-alpha-D-manno-heptose-7-phosphate kinase
LIKASAPVRICDIGGWTDSWFGGPGRVLNIAVRPGVEVLIHERTDPGEVVLDVESFGDRYALAPGAPPVGRHPLLEAAIHAFMPFEDVGIEVTVRSPVPPGCGVGTSAAVAVALVGGLAVVRRERMSPRDTAYAAHRLEVDALGESGIQDQLSAATGGINYLEIDAYPEATVHTMPAWDELDDRLTLVFVGRAHDSADLHRQVIGHLKSRESDAFGRLRSAAIAAGHAVLTQDLVAFGRAMTANTEAQRSLHPMLVGADAETVFAAASRRGALGWKVNGAGGDGGSVTVLSATRQGKDDFESHIAASHPNYQVLPIRISSTGLEAAGAL